MNIPGNNPPKPPLRLAKRDKLREGTNPWAPPEPKDPHTNVQQILRENVRRDEFARRIYGTARKTAPARKPKGSGGYFLMLIAGYAGGSALFWFLPKHNQNTMIIVAVGMLFYTIALTWFMRISRDEY